MGVLEREQGERDIQKEEGKVFRNNYKGHMDKTKGGGRNQGREVRMAGVGGGVVGVKGRQLYSNNKKEKENLLEQIMKENSPNLVKEIDF